MAFQSGNLESHYTFKMSPKNILTRWHFIVWIFRMNRFEEFSPIDQNIVVHFHHKSRVATQTEELRKKRHLDLRHFNSQQLWLRTFSNLFYTFSSLSFSLSCLSSYPCQTHIHVHRHSLLTYALKMVKLAQIVQLEKIDTKNKIFFCR